MGLRLVALALLASLTVGCGQKAGYIEPGGARSIVSVTEVNTRDILLTADHMVESLLSTAVLERARNHPALVIVDKITNDTDSRWDTGELLYGIREQLVNSGKAAVVNWGNNAESGVARGQLDRKVFLEGGSQSDLPSADFTLTGKVSSRTVRAGNVRETTYTFRLTLWDLNNSVEVWTEQKQITKQGSKPSIGY
jgi:hypothetical protein